MRRDILRSKAYLYLTEFFSGMGVMAVELGASRLLAPYFSSSQIVWTIIIGTIMIAMALGNIYGGRSADRDPSPDILYRRLLIASVWIAAIPVIGKYIIILISGALIFTISTNFLVIAAFAACMVIFVFPLFLLGTVTPSLAKYTVGSLDDSGRVVGQLGAANTIGSIIGTFLPTFVTIPAVGTAVTFLIFSGIILLIGIVYFFSKRTHIRSCVICIVIYVLCAVSGSSGSFAFWQSDLTYEGESIYNYLQVAEDEKAVRLSTNVLFGVQSITMKDDSLTGMYYDYAMAAPVMVYGSQDRDATAADEGLSMLILGMGTGTYGRQCSRYFDGTDIEGVEIDGKITELSYKYFDASPDVPVTTYDGRAYLQTIDGKYDVIMVDAYQDISIPFQMSSIEFFKEVYDHLNDDGVMVVNMNMRSDTEGNINEYLSDTIASVFPSVATVDVRGYTNRELFAVKEGEVSARFDAGIDYIRKKGVSTGSTDEELIALMAAVRDGMQEYEGGQHIFTDDRAPVELLGMREIDGMIRDEVGYYRSVYERDGIDGVLGEI
ncbi:MAG: fused MFS/spermidine synthase, partial [Lachnospiraceae bacterium]|nr:fused MFS/spermidine synthase [Lachnospiraceae bacterium]